jgi:hypothetical protein
LPTHYRWVDNLDYKRSKAPWSVDEDEAILVGIQVFGRSNFSSIAKLLPGRNTSAVKIRIRTLFRWKIIVSFDYFIILTTLSLRKLATKKTQQAHQVHWAKSWISLERDRKKLVEVSHSC